MRRPLSRPVHAAALLLLVSAAFALTDERPGEAFEQLDELLPTPNGTRTASGAPGHEYWQQRADYEIHVTLDDERRHLDGSETISYQNNSPDALDYLWVQLDPNLWSPSSHAVATTLAPGLDSQSYDQLGDLLERRRFDGSVNIQVVMDGGGSPLPHTIVDTMMRVDLNRTLLPGASTTLLIKWDYAINDHDRVGGRTGYEHFEDDDNSLYEMAQFYPRMAAYTDYSGWQHKQYLGSGEFTLEFGDYLLHITVPDDHVVAASGVLQNPEEVLTAEQRQRLADALQSETPSFVITPDEARENESSTPEGTRTWTFFAQNVRDVAWASSRKFIWDAAGKDVGGRTVACMSYYPNEGEPLWSRYSTQAIAHTLDVYGKFTFPYPYPVAISVNGPVGGMEYPMLCFNGPRPEDDGTYSERTKYGLISVIIHEVGHNWFPMIVNSDERQWTWMDEGLNTFVQFLAESEWSDDYPSRRGDPENIVGYLTSDHSVPIMTNSEALLQKGNNAYSKPATALNVLRETVMGRELFDFAFRTYAQRWQFKRPQPADLFRTMEDASAVDLDWFWRGWFYTTEHCDMALEGVQLYRVDDGEPLAAAEAKRAERDGRRPTLSTERNAELPKRTHAFPELLDFYDSYDDLAVSDDDVRRYEKLVAGLDDDERELLALDLNFYVLRVANLGGLVMPVILELTYEDGSTELLTRPAEIWRRNPVSASTLHITDKRVVSVELDPRRETADADDSNDHWPPRMDERSISLRGNRSRGGNPMQDAAKAAEKAAKQASEETDEPEDAGGADEG